MKHHSIQIRVDEQLKKQIEKIFDDIGLDTPTAVRIFFTKVAATGGIPFDLRVRQEEVYTPTQVKAFDRMARLAKRGKGVTRTFSRPDDLLNDLHG